MGFKYIRPPVGHSLFGMRTVSPLFNGSVIVAVLCSAIVLVHKIWLSGTQLRKMPFSTEATKSNIIIVVIVIEVNAVWRPQLELGVENSYILLLLRRMVAHRHHIYFHPVSSGVGLVRLALLYCLAEAEQQKAACVNHFGSFTVWVLQVRFAGENDRKAGKINSLYPCEAKRGELYFCGHFVSCLDFWSLAQHDAKYTQGV